MVGRRRGAAAAAAAACALVLVGAAIVSGPVAPAGSVVAPSTRAVAAKAPVPCSVGAGVTAEQVVVVRARGSRATVKACTRTSSGRYVLSLGPYSGHVGRNGVAPAGAKREGDGRTPSGVYPLRSGFGVHVNPGVRFAWRHVDGHDVWVDDSASRYYNLHERTPVRDRWSSAEPLRVSPAYNYAQVIGYNEKRVPHRGSAIFFHVDEGRGTAGCVSIPQNSLLRVLRWERAGAVISIQRA